MRWLRTLERSLLIFGLLLLALFLAARVHQSVLANAEVMRFRARKLAPRNQVHIGTLTDAKPDFSLWSEQRIRDYQESLAAHFAPALAILRIPRIHLEVPILEGTDELSLNRGVGHVENTSRPGEAGNVAIAGHRDGFFRGLKDIELGDTIELELLASTATYRIDRITIVDPSDVSVLRPRPRESLTLITCYPFYFAGSAPKRFIVQASVVGSAPANAVAGGKPQSQTAKFEQPTRAK